MQPQPTQQPRSNNMSTLQLIGAAVGLAAASFSSIRSFLGNNNSGNNHSGAAPTSSLTPDQALGGMMSGTVSGISGLSLVAFPIEVKSQASADVANLSLPPRIPDPR